MTQKMNIGLLTPIVDGFYYGNLIDSISDCLSSYDVRLFVIQTAKHTAVNRIVYNYPLGLDYMDGWLILSQAVYPEYLHKLCQTGKPVTMVSCDIASSNCQYVLTDNITGMSAAVEHLIDHGHNKIAFVGWAENFDVQQRFIGYKNALAKRGIPYNPEFFININNCMQTGGYEAAKKILKSGIDFTAVAAASDFNAIGLIDELKNAGYRVPDDIAVIGFDNTDIGAEFNPPLTSVDQNIRELGYRAAKILYDRINGNGNTADKIYVPTKLIHRHSCGCMEIPDTSATHSGKNEGLNKKKAEFLSSVVENSITIGNSLIKASYEEIKSLSWVRYTNFHWACLGLFDRYKELVLERCFNRNEESPPDINSHYPIEAFPPLQHIPDTTHSRDMIWLHPIGTEHFEWGMLVLVGPFEKTKLNIDFDSMAHYFDLLSLSLEREVQSENRYRNLLNNASQGFFTFGESLVVDNEYSSECTKIFRTEIKGQLLPGLIYPDDIQQQDFLGNILKDILTETDTNRLNMYMGLLPDETILNKRSIKIEYKLIEDPIKRNKKKFMLILTDITDKRNLESKIEHEKDILKMVIQAVINYNNFIENLKDYLNFCRVTLIEIIADMPLADACSEIFRYVHTFKGNFSQLEMVNIVHTLHNFESEISEIKNNIQSWTNDSFREFIDGCDMISWLKSDLDILKGFLGEDYFNRDNVILVGERTLREIEKKAVEILPPVECKNFLYEIKRLRCRPFKELLSNYPEYIQKLSQRLKKLIVFDEIAVWNEMPVDTTSYKDFAKSLVHVFRNIIEHGIESPDERIASGKDEYGKVYCAIEFSNNNIILVISDDGRGIDFERIKRIALNKGLYGPEEIKLMPEEQLLRHIFDDGFSTSSNITDLSGRGVGLSAVKRETDKLGGRIEVKTEKGNGTTFRFLLPFIGLNNFGSLMVHDFVSPIFNTAEKLLCSSFGLQLESKETVKEDNGNRIHLNKVTSFIKIKGIFRGNFFLSMDLELAEKMVKSYIQEKITLEEEQLIIEDVLSECTNNILGNSLGLIGKFEEYIAIETPETIFARELTIKYSESNVCICKLLFKGGSAILGLSYHDAV